MRRDPQDRDGVRKRLLTAAADEFAENGVNAAQLARIAYQAGTSVRIISSHFASKAQLYEAVLNAIYETPWFEDIFRELDMLEPAEALRYLIGAMFARYCAHLGHYALLIEQDENGARGLKTPHRVHTLFQRLLEVLDRVLARGVTAGIFRAGLNATWVYLSIVSLTAPYMKKLHARRALLGENFALPAETIAWRECIAELILAGLNPVLSGALPDEGHKRVIGTSHAVAYLPRPARPPAAATAQKRHTAPHRH